MNVAAREGDFLESFEGLIFDVKGICHPPDRVICYVRYVPDAKGERKKGVKSYRKIYDLEERHTFLKENFPHYVYFDPVFQRELQGVPLENIEKMHSPREKLLELIDADKRDALEECTLQLVQALDIPAKALGVSGSILIGLHTAESDIDIMVYGEEHCMQAYKTLQRLREKGVVQRFDRKRALEKALFRWGSVNDDLIKLEQRKIMHGLFQHKEYFFRFLKIEYVKYGDLQYIPLHKATIKAKIADDTESIFTPCCYEIEDSSIEGVIQVMSLRGRFCEQVRKGDTIAARGTVEKVVSARGEYYQIMLGDAGDYLLALRKV